MGGENYIQRKKSLFRAVLVAMRPADWIKNGFVAAPLFFSGQVTNAEKLFSTVQVVVAFCLLSSAVYLFNDVKDQEHDRIHPKKKSRPIASGDLSTGRALILAISLCAGALMLVRFSGAVVGLLLAYALINVAYSCFVKHIVILDVFTIATGFVLRVFAGGVAIDVAPSSWLVLATFQLSLFLALAKRRHELSMIRVEANNSRPVLDDYSVKLVDELISVVTPVTVITYMLYTLDEATMARFHSGHLYLSTVFVTFGIFRYLYLIHQRDLGGSPTELVLNDLPLIGAILGWVGSFSLIVYLT